MCPNMLNIFSVSCTREYSGSADNCYRACGRGLVSAYMLRNERRCPATPSVFHHSDCGTGGGKFYISNIN